MRIISNTDKDLIAAPPDAAQRNRIMRAYAVIPVSPRLMRVNGLDVKVFSAGTTEQNRRRAENWASLLRYRHDVMVIELAHSRITYYKKVLNT